MKRLVCLAALLISTACLAAPTLTRSAGVSAVPGSGSHATAAPACGTTTLTQSTSDAITSLNSVACSSASGHAANSYYRAFASAVIPNGFSACGVQVGVEQATSGSGTQPLVVNLYSNAGGAFPSGTLTLVGTATANVADQTLTMIDVPVTGTVAAGSDLVVEVHTPDGQSQGNLFFIGSNAAGQSAPSYIAAPDCGVNTPTDLATIGFSNMQIVLNVEGTPTPLTFSVGGTVSGLGAGRSVVLRNNGGDDVTVSANGNFTFPTSIASGAAYAVSVATQPAGQRCTVSSGSGTVSANVADVAVACSNVSLNAIPTLSEWGMILMAGLVAMTALPALRRRQR